MDLPGPLGESAIEILESVPNLSQLNGVNVSKILETGNHVIDAVLQPRLPEWTAEEPLADRVINAMWLYLMTYRLADEEKIDETSVWYVFLRLASDNSILIWLTLLTCYQLWLLKYLHKFKSFGMWLLYVQKLKLQKSFVFICLSWEKEYNYTSIKLVNRSWIVENLNSGYGDSCIFFLLFRMMKECLRKSKEVNEGREFWGICK